MTLRNRGEPAGFKRVGAPVMARAMRRANEQGSRTAEASARAVSRRRLLLASRGIPWFGGASAGAGAVRCWYRPTAANPPGEPGIVDEVDQELTRAGLRVERVDLDGETVGAVRAAVLAADVVAVSGGDPFLLAAARRTGSVRPLARRSRPEWSTSATAPGRSSPARHSSRCA